jgi:hypothetical protein
MRNIFDIFCSIFGQYSIGNEDYGKLCCSVILGQMLKYKRIYVLGNYIDLRTSLFYFAPSGTGKSMGTGFVQEICEKINMEFGSLDISSDAGLIGSPEVLEERVNQEELDNFSDEEIQKMLREGNLVKRGKFYFMKIASKTSAALDGEGIVHYDEGEVFLKEHTHSESILFIAQKVLNPIGHTSNTVVKALRDGKIECISHKSFLMTSYMVDNVAQTIFDKGFFQRLLVYVKDVTENERLKVSNIRMESLGKKTEKQLDIDELVTRFKEIQTFYEENNIDIDDSSRRLFKARLLSLHNTVKETDGTIRDILHKFLPRYENFMVVLAHHHAAGELKTAIRPVDVKFAYDTIDTLLSSIIVWLENDKKISAQSKQAERGESHILAMIEKTAKADNQIDSEGYIDKNQFLRYIGDVARVKSSKSIYDRYSKYKTSQNIIEKQIGVRKKVKILPKKIR